MPPSLDKFPRPLWAADSGGGVCARQSAKEGVLRETALYPTNR